MVLNSFPLNRDGPLAYNIKTTAWDGEKREGVSP
jgi:hypothetical protein